jgi:hypothetical protein
VISTFEAPTNQAVLSGSVAPKREHDGLTGPRFNRKHKETKAARRRVENVMAFIITSQVIKRRMWGL